MSVLEQSTRKELEQLIRRQLKEKKEKLPRENKLAEMFLVSRTTIRKILQDMEVEGKIFRIHGKGTFINSNYKSFHTTLNPMDSFHIMLKREGYHVDIRLYDTINMKTPLHIKTTGYYKEDQIIRTSKAYFADGEFCVGCHDYIPLSWADEIGDIKDFSNSIFQFIYEKRNQKLSWGSVTIEAVDINHLDFDKNVLKHTNNQAFLKLFGIEFDEHNTWILFTEEYIDTSMITLNTVRKRNINYQ